MIRRDRLRGHRFILGASGVSAEVQRSCRDELKVLYTAPAFTRGTWERLSRLGQAQVLEASKLDPRMRDVFRVSAPGMQLEGAVGATTLLAFFRGFGRLRARHLLQAALEAEVDPRD